MKKARLVLLGRVLSVSLLSALAPACPFSSFEVEPATGSSLGGSAGASGGAPTTGGTNGGQGGSPIKAASPQPQADRYFMLQGSELTVRSPGVLANDSPSELQVARVDVVTEALDFDMDVEVSGDGRLEFRPDPRFFGVFELTYEVQNTNSVSAESRVTVHVLPSDVDLSLLGEGFGGVVFEGGGGEELGSAVRGAVDLNGDQMDDLLVGARGADAGAGAVLVVFGGPAVEDRSLSSQPSSDQSKYYAVVNGEVPDGALGASVAVLRDQAGAAIALVLGAPGGEGRVERVDLGPPGEGAGPLFNPVRRTALTGDQRETGIGSLVDAAGDIDGNGSPDILVASRVGDLGQLRVVFGQADPSESGAIADAPGLVLRGTEVGAGFPLAFAAVADLNGDSRGEVLAASRSNILLLHGGEQYPSTENEVSIDGSAFGFRAVRTAPGLSGAVSVVGDEGGNSSPELVYCDGIALCRVVRTPLSTLSNGFRVTGFGATTSSLSVVSAGDLDADGITDLAFAEDSVVYVLYGRHSGQADVDVAMLAGAGYRIRMPEGGAVSALSAAGDFNRDGVDDLAITDSGARRGAGRVYVVHGVRSRRP